MKVTIIGSGIAGLAIAVRLACAGHQVTVFEANTYPGGKLSEIYSDGFRFDAGPSLFTLPQLVDELFSLAGKLPQDHFSYIQLNKACNYFFEDGTRFSSFHSRDEMASELINKLGIKDTRPFFKHLDNAKFRYEITAPIFIEKSLHRLKNYFSIETLKGILSAGKLNLFESMSKENEKVFSNKHLQSYFNRFATYNGSNPYQTPALLNMIPHLEHNIGSYFPIKGMHSITQSIFALAKELGVEFHFNSKVEEILVKNNKACGVKVNSFEYLSDVVVSNMDIHPTYKKLLPNVKAPNRILKQEKSSSALIFYWGINKVFEELDLHNILFTENYKEEFEAIFNKKIIYQDPTIYINITSKLKTDDAPKDCENWFVMINVPNNQGQDWDTFIAEAKTNILQKIKRVLKVDVGNLILTEQILDPRSIETKTSSFAGALYGNASNNKYAAFLRHKNFSSKIAGLYFCGGSVHPGGGIPLCLNSAKIVSQLISEDLGGY